MQEKINGDVFNNKSDIACYAGLMIIKKNYSSLTLIKEFNHGITYP